MRLYIPGPAGEVASQTGVGGDFLLFSHRQRYAESMTTRSRRRLGKKTRWPLVLAALLAVLVAGVLAMPMLVLGWVRSYLQAEAFRERMETLFGTELDGEARLSPLRWNGDEVTVAELAVRTVDGWSVQADGMRVTLDWNAFRQGKWRLVGGGADLLLLQHTGGRSGGMQPRLQTAAASPAVAGSEEALPSWLQAYLPDTVEVEPLTISRVEILHPGPWNLREARLKIAGWRQGEDSLQAVLEGGRIETPVRLPALERPATLKVTRASLRLMEQDIHLKEATLSWLAASEIIVSGHLKPEEATWEAQCSFTRVPINECVTEDWRLRLAGELEGELNSRGTFSSPPEVTGPVRVKQGMLTALPVLDRLAAYTGVEKFRRLVLDKAEAELTVSGPVCQFDKVELHSNGLLHLQGSLVVQNGQIQGNFLLGVTPETLKWIPGAQQHVFTAQNPAGPPGMLWTPLQINGSLDAPREDLSGRLAEAAGRALLDAPGEIVGKGSELLLKPALGEEAAKLPGSMIKGATEATGDAVKSGVKVLEGISGGLFGQ